MAVEFDWRDDHALTSEERETVAWAGLPIDLDLAFSSNQRDKVYEQHVMRKRGNQVSSWLEDGAQTGDAGRLSSG